MSGTSFAELFPGIAVLVVVIVGYLAVRYSARHARDR